MQILENCWIQQHKIATFETLKDCCSETTFPGQMVKKNRKGTFLVQNYYLFLYFSLNFWQILLWLQTKPNFYLWLYLGAHIYQKVIVSINPILLPLNLKKTPFWPTNRKYMYIENGLMHSCHSCFIFYILG